MMDYNQVVNWLFNKLPMYQIQGGVALKMDLSNITKLVTYLGNPHKSLSYVHIAGTNGKGSTSVSVASVLQQAGYKVGLYTSPHLKDYRERIRVNGSCIDKAYVVDFINEHYDFLESSDFSFFEMTLALAFCYFRDNNLDIVVLEVGLGGRLDATNIVTPIVCAITNISLDHTQWLGDNIKAITKEKAGIIKSDIPVVLGRKQDEVVEVVTQIANHKNAPLYMAADIEVETFNSILKGEYQHENIRTATVILDILRFIYRYDIRQQHFKSGFLNIIENTGFQGRWQILSNKPLVVCDTAHNKDGVVHVVQQLNAIGKKNLHIVLGMVADKDVNAILDLLPKDAIYYFCQPSISRALLVEALYSKSIDVGLNGKIFTSVEEAYNQALVCCSDEDVIFIGGSTFVVAEIIECF